MQHSIIALFLALLFTLPSAGAGLSPVAKDPEQVLRIETWSVRPLSVEFGNNFLGLLPFSELDQPAMPIVTMLKSSWMLNQDWAMGLAFGSWGNSFAAFSAHARYYLPWGEELKQLALSRLYFEGEVALLYKNLSKNPMMADMVYGLGIVPQFGIESRWDHYLLRAYTGLAFSRQPDGELRLSPILSSGFGFSFAFQDGVPSEWYKQNILAVLQQPAAPLFQISVGTSYLEANALTAWLINEHWGIGLFHSFNADLAPFYEKSGQRLGLKARYYHSPVHMGGQWFVEADANFGEYPGAGVMFGLEHRELWGFVVDFGIGASVQVRDQKQQLTGAGMIYAGIGYAWALPTAKGDFSALPVSEHDGHTHPE